MIVRRNVGAFRVFIGSNAMAAPLLQQRESSNWGRDGLDRVIKLWECVLRGLCSHVCCCFYSALRDARALLECAIALRRLGVESPAFLSIADLAYGIAF